MLLKTQHQNFEHKLFASLAQIFPELNVRNFSKWLGKSCSYWSSITSQGLPVSTSALKNLNEYIECRKILLHHEDALHIRLTRIQELIKREIVGRFLIETESFDNIEEQVSNTLNGNENYGALPFLLNRYR
jgi:hypothetical protein